jgi:LPS export ABC transporter permease LptG
MIASAVSFVLYNMAVPTANYAQHRLQARIFISSDLNREIQPRAFFEKIPDLLLYADAANPADGTLQRVLLVQRTPDGTEEISSSGRARIEYQQEGGALNFRLEDVISHSWNRAEPEDYQIAARDEETIIRPPDIFTREMLRTLKEPPPRNLREQNVSELLRTLEEFREMRPGLSRTRFINEAKVELHKKFAIPATCIVWALLGLPLALSQRRGGRAWGFVISLVVISLEYFLLTMGEQMADRGQLPAWLAIWMGNIGFTLLALLLLTLGRRWSWEPPALARIFRRRREEEAPDRSLPPEESLPAEAHPPAATGEAGSAGEPPGAREEEEAGPAPRRRWIPAVDRYLLRLLLRVGALVILSLSLLFALQASLELVDEMAKNGQPISLLFQYVASVLPQAITTYVLPLGLCVATLITFGLLSRTHELTALRSAGIGPLRVSAVFVAVAALTSALSFGALDSVLPATNQKAIQIRDKLRGRSPRSYRHPERRWIFGSQGDLVTFKNFRFARKQILDLNVLRFHPDTLFIRERFFAKRATWSPPGSWLLEEGWRREFSDTGETYEPFDRFLLEGMDEPGYFTQEWKAPAQMNMRELHAYVSDMERRGYETRELRVGLHRKVAVPAVCFVMVLIALPFGLRIERRGPLFGLGVALLIAGVYYFLLQASGKLGEVGVLPPVMAAWTPNVIFSGAGLYLMASSRW